ncbi:DUF1622 domain-containing protein [Myxococcus sp. K38C18041901]|uniref:DUF1622 domain-containing protein n=1 Tax=Myxococcus guangdongensis TaxID=2906760 RepID=UPI0020A70D39|nr:DUF1622 domain-containing protein [Myxococcus guangdongensis]MCP3064519.1 DUF1622 domain-containing protein [Myxococcus guangdongensis]
MEDLISEAWLHGAVTLLVRLVEAAAALVIFTGAAIGFVRFVLATVQRKHDQSFTRIRLTLGRFLALGLEFQLGADLLRTAVAPTWEQIGQVAAVAALRTALNYFLGREIREEQRQDATTRGAPTRFDDTRPPREQAPSSSKTGEDSEAQAPH